MKVVFTNYMADTNEVYGQELWVDSNIARAGSGELLFDNCTFVFFKNGKLKIQDCAIKNCTFKGLENLHDFTTESGILEIISCKVFRNNQFIQQFRTIHIQESVISVLIDESIAIYYTITSSEVFNSKVLGACEYFQTRSVSFLSPSQSLLFSKKIIKRAICEETIFDDVKLNPFYLATKCHNKTTLDISRATLIDHWSRLRKKYTGLSLIIVFILTILYFTPIFFQSFFLISLSKIDISFYNIQKIHLWKALLFNGKQGFDAFIHAALTTVLVFYNVTRIIITISIAKLREEEIFLKDSNFNLVSIHPHKYKTLLKFDKILGYLFWISIAYTLFKLLDTLIIEVPIFN